MIFKTSAKGGQVENNSFLTHFLFNFRKHSLKISQIFFSVCMFRDKNNDFILL